MKRANNFYSLRLLFNPHLGCTHFYINGKLLTINDLLNDMIQYL